MKTKLFYLIILSGLLSNCTTYQPAVHTLDIEDCWVVGYSTKKKHYIVENYKGWQHKIKIDDEDTLQIGDSLFIKDEFNYSCID